MVVFIQTLWTQCPIPWSDTKHIVNSSKTEQTAGAGDRLQTCHSLSILLMSVPYWWRLIYLRTVTGLKRDTDLADLLYIGAQSRSLCLCMLSCCVCLSPSLTVGDRFGPLQLFPKLNCLCGLCIIVSHPQASDLLTWALLGSPSSTLRTEWGRDLDIQSLRGQM